VNITNKEKNINFLGYVFKEIIITKLQYRGVQFRKRRGLVFLEKFQGGKVSNMQNPEPHRNI